MFLHTSGLCCLYLSGCMFVFYSVSCLRWVSDYIKSAVLPGVHRYAFLYVCVWTCWVQYMCQHTGQQGFQQDNALNITCLIKKTTHFTPAAAVFICSSMLYWLQPQSWSFFLFKKLTKRSSSDLMKECLVLQGEVCTSFNLISVHILGNP